MKFKVTYWYRRIGSTGGWTTGAMKKIVAPTPEAATIMIEREEYSKKHEIKVTKIELA
ncbi:hypothetical protein [Rodentibacter trehalosifermentans]|uniref:hypothetical protein n=1 Tax=Rodentibacter trehalosifermentans TaxID=1908263 RepID=UPI0013F5C91B|nr:hypothetical protein [Rodentibacter trehalosifermentans]